MLDFLKELINQNSKLSSLISEIYKRRDDMEITSLAKHPKFQN